MRRIAFLSDSNTPITARLMREAVKYASDRPDVEVAALVTGFPHAWEYSLKSRLWQLLRAVVIAVSNRGLGFENTARFRVPPEIAVIGPREAGANTHELVKRLRDDLGVDVLLSLYYTPILSHDFLECFSDAINYHPGLLPRNRGLEAIAFALYNEDPEIGFTFHRMTAGIDEGPILHQDSVAVTPGAPPITAARELTDLSVSALSTVLDLVLEGVPGEEQTGPASYHSRREADSLLVIEQPGEMKEEELRRRLRAFGTVRMTIQGEVFPVTRIRRSKAQRSQPAFTTSDGVRVVADRIAYVPVRLYLLRRALRRTRYRRS